MRDRETEKERGRQTDRDDKRSTCTQAVWFKVYNNPALNTS